MNGLTKVEAPLILLSFPPPALGKPAPSEAAMLQGVCEQLAL